MKISKEQVILAYTDDIVVMGDMKDKFIKTISKLFRTNKSISLYINENKTNYLTIERIIPSIDYITVNLK